MKMAETLISTRPLEIIFKKQAENRKTRGVLSFSDVQADFRENEP
jgi:hypothetical protein